MSQPKPIHLAKSIKNLDIIAHKRGKLINRIDKLCDCADKVYMCAKEDPNDEEKTYIYLVRYCALIDDVRTVTQDDRFTQSRFGNNYRWCKEQLALLRATLNSRYNELYENNSVSTERNDLPSLDQEIAITEHENKLFSSELFAVCQEIYQLHLMQTYGMLIIDIRQASEYEASHIKEINNVNVPEVFIKPGLSANALELSLPPHIKESFKNRASYDVLILMDWDTTSKNYSMSKLQVLYEIVTKWEFKVTYRFKPFILDGGYLAWIEKYPTLSTNSNFKYAKEYSNFDELLHLDNIQYPSDVANTSIPPVLNEQQTEVVLAPAPTTNNSLSKLHKVALKQLENEQNLLNCVNRYANSLIGVMSNRTDETVANFKKDKSIIRNEISKLESIKIQLEERKKKLMNEFYMNSRFAPGNDGEVISKMKDIKLIEEEIVKTYMLRRDKQSKIDVQDTERDEAQPRSIVAKAPLVERKNKPTTMNYLAGTVKFTTNGLTGLENIRNTCYMNTLLQCLRHLAPVYVYLCNGEYKNFLERSEVHILREFAQIVRTLWMNAHTVIQPTEFYEKLCKIEPMYGEGQHECVHMFFLFLLETLHEDTVTEIDESHIENCAAMAWLMKFKGKFSYFLKTFYHQIKETQVCPSCGKKAIRFQSEPTLMLAVPERESFSVQSVLQSYFTQDCKYCTKCNVQCKVTKVFSYCPPILTIVLKRYHQKGSKFYRNNNACEIEFTGLRVGPQRYNLHAIALHEGTLNSGHYTAACLNPTDQKWYEYNDSSVKPLFEGHSKIKVKAYVLFYVAAAIKHSL